MRQRHSLLPSVPPLFFIFATIVIDRLGEGLIFPLLPFLVAEFKFDALSLGLLVSTFSAAQFLAAPVLGALSDRYGRRPILLISVLGTAASYFMFAAATQPWQLFASRALDGATGGVISTAQAYVADTSAPQDRAKNFGLIGAAFGLGFILGPVLGGGLAVVDLKLPMIFAGIVTLLNFVLGYFTLPESLIQDKPRRLNFKDFNPLRPLRQGFREPKISGLLTAYFMFSFAFAGFTSIFVLFLNRRFGWGPMDAAIVFLVIGVASTVVQAGLIRKLLPRFGEVKLTLYGLGFVALGFLLSLLVPPQSLWAYPGIYLSMVVLAFGVGLFSPSLRSLIANRVSDQQQGQTQGVSQSLVSIANIFGPAWAGWTFDREIRAPGALATLLILVALGCTIFSLKTPTPD
jgi:MFS transporter, DHA1 family, tetracycline resistance protein